MGTKYDFDCVNCGYKATVSGGRDCGFCAVVRTMICANCTELVDVLIGAHGNDGPIGDPEYDRDIGLCPSCRGHDLSNWPGSHPCPKCKARMTDNGPPLMWD